MTDWGSSNTLFIFYRLDSEGAWFGAKLSLFAGKELSFERAYRWAVVCTVTTACMRANYTKYTLHCRQTTFAFRKPQSTQCCSPGSSSSFPIVRKHNGGWPKKEIHRIFNSARHTLTAVCPVLALNLTGVSFFYSC